MAKEPAGPASEPVRPSDEEYQAFCSALSATVRGRAFLAEHARRQQKTAPLETAIQKLESAAIAKAPNAASSFAPASAQEELQGLLQAIRSIQTDIDLSGLAMRLAKLVSLIELIENRIEAIVTVKADTSQMSPSPQLSPAKEAPASKAAESDMPRIEDAIAGSAPERLQEAAATAPPGEEENNSNRAPAHDKSARVIPPENSIDASTDKVIAAHATGPTPKAASSVNKKDAQPIGMPEVKWEEEPAGRVNSLKPAASSMPSSTAALAIAAVIEQAAAAAPEEPEVRVLKAGTIPPPASFTGEDFSSAPAKMIKRSRAAEALAPITMLSDDERIALFT